MGGIFQWPDPSATGGGGAIAAGLPLEGQVAYLMKIVRDFLVPLVANLAPNEFMDYGPGVSENATIDGGSATGKPPPWMPEFDAGLVAADVDAGDAASTTQAPPAYGPLGVARVITARFENRVEIQMLESASGTTSGAIYRGVHIAAKVDNPAVGDIGTAWKLPNGTDIIFFPESPSLDAVSEGAPSDCDDFPTIYYTTDWAGLYCGGSTAAASCAQTDYTSSCAWTPDGPGNTDLTLTAEDKGSGESPRYVWRAVMTHGAVNGTVTETYEKPSTTGSRPEGVYTRTTSNCADAPDRINIIAGSCP